MKFIKSLLAGAAGIVLAATSMSGIANAGSHGWEPTKPVDFIIMAGKGGGADKIFVDASNCRGRNSLIARLCQLTSLEVLVQGSGSRKKCSRS